jgi:hypothetical protein
MIEVDAQAGINRLVCNQHWTPKCTNCGHSKKSRDMGAWTHPTNGDWQNDTKICIS